MRMTFSILLVAVAMLWGAASFALADEVSPPKAVPQTRREMLDALDSLKSRTSRIPLPPPEARGAENAGPLGVVNNGLMRSHYLPTELRAGGGSRQPDPALALDNQFVVELFWIVSRVNNCHYCLGHQEAKLAAAGMTEAGLLALDTDWKSFPAAQQAAFAFARKLTSTPQAITDADIDALRPHFQPTQILGIAMLIARYNSTNRWTDSLGIPQESHREFRSDLTNDEQDRPSQVTMKGYPPRAGFRDFMSWKTAFDRAAVRTPRLPLAEATAVAKFWPRARGPRRRGNTSVFLPTSPWRAVRGSRRCGPRSRQGNCHATSRKRLPGWRRGRIRPGTCSTVPARPSWHGGSTSSRFSHWV